jgi:hypothetical protein
MRLSGPSPSSRRVAYPLLVLQRMGPLSRLLLTRNFRVLLETRRLETTEPRGKNKLEGHTRAAPVFAFGPNAVEGFFAIDMLYSPALDLVVPAIQCATDLR